MTDRKTTDTAVLAAAAAVTTLAAHPESRIMRKALGLNTKAIQRDPIGSLHAIAAAIRKGPVSEPAHGSRPTTMR